MAIYNIDGVSLSNAYDVNGNSLSNAYDISGNEVLEPDLTVMTFNVQWFTGINSQSEMLAEIIDGNDADIIGMQEISKTGTVASVGLNALSDYPYITLSNHKNYNGLVSKITMSDIVVADYETQDEYDQTQYGETRCYMKCYVTVGEKRICWFNTHLSFHTPSAKYGQIKELFDMAELEDYVIITGDMNSTPLSVSDDDYTNMFKQFVDAGYKLANCSQIAGFTKTWTSATNPSSLEDLTHPYDNIIVSSNIDFVSIKYDLTKFLYLNGGAYDHTPIVAELVIH